MWPIERRTVYNFTEQLTPFSGGDDSCRALDDSQQGQTRLGSLISAAKCRSPQIAPISLHCLQGIYATHTANKVFKSYDNKRVG